MLPPLSSPPSLPRQWAPQQVQDLPVRGVLLARHVHNLPTSKCGVHTGPPLDPSVQRGTARGLRNSWVEASKLPPNFLCASVACRTPGAIVRGTVPAAHLVFDHSSLFRNLASLGVRAEVNARWANIHAKELCIARRAIQETRGDGMNAIGAHHTLVCAVVSGRDWSHLKHAPRRHTSGPAWAIVSRSLRR